ncbi:MAG: FecR family protein [Parabacteroides gordonii]|uniref:FecR family protein n=1 Tax=Parabacteroides gordonii TaxID=574930 RepID=UPI003A841B80
MDDKEYIDFEELLIRYLQGTGDSQSLQQLLEIVRKSENKKSELARLKAIYDSLSVQVDALKFPIDASWEKMRQKIDSGKIVEKSNGSIFRRIIIQWPYVAVFLLVVLLTGQYFYYQDKDQSIESLESYTRFVVEKDGGKSSLFLPDGTKVLLNAGTTIQYPTQFDQKERTVILEGEGYFEVVKNEQKPFIVRLKGYDVKVLGTVFNVKAYPDMDYSTTSLISGKVFLTSYDTEGVVCNEQILQPSETARIDRQSGIITTFRGDEDFQLAWTKGLYKFKDKPFSEVVAELERLYDVTILIEDEKLAQAIFTGSFVLENTIEKVLKPLAQYNKFRYRMEGQVIRIYSK